MMMLNRILDSFLLEQVEEPTYKDKFRVSGAGLCYLKRIFEKEGVPISDPFPSRTLRIFSIGSLFHEWLQDILEKKGVLIGKEVEVEDEIKKGHIDAVIAFEGKLYIYDFKTVHSHKFFHLAEEGIDIHYCLQAWTYKQLYEKAFGQKVDGVFLAYISKDDLLIEEINVGLVLNIEKLTNEDWNRLLRIYKKEEPFEGPQNKWECQYCIYRSICRDVAKKEGYIK